MRSRPGRSPLCLPLALAGALLMACGGQETDASSTARREAEPAPSRAVPRATEVTATQEPVTDDSRPARVVASPVHPDPRFRCVMPALPIPRPRACARGAGYPNCKWKLPHAIHSEQSWRRWRNTITAHQYARPALVALLVTTAREMHRLAPQQPFVIGDLDAPGPRHATHDRGVDADLYLPGTLMVENAGGGRYEDNYEGKSAQEIESLRERVLLLAQILATCSEGKLRIYYNDDVVRRRFLRWFEQRGYSSPFRAPMLHHNHLHDFHFHLSVPEDLPLLPSEPGSEPQPVEPIEAPPTAEEVAASNALSSRSAPTLETATPDTEAQEDTSEEAADEEAAAPPPTPGGEPPRPPARAPRASSSPNMAPTQRPRPSPENRR